MSQRLKRLTIITLTVLGMSGFFAPARGYVLQGPHILELMIQRLGEAKRLRVSQRLIIQDPSSDPPSTEIEEIVRYAYPEAFRSDISSETAQRIHLFVKGDALTIIDGKATVGETVWFDRYKDLLLYHSRVLLTNHLTLSGIDVSISSLGRFEDKIAFVVGAEYPAETRSQVWIEKDTFRPIRMILKKLPAYPDIGAFEFRYRNWQEFDGVFYPMTIEFFQDGLLVRRLRVESVTVDPSFSEDLFDLHALQSRYVSKDMEKKTTEALDEVKKTIEEFKRRFE